MNGDRTRPVHQVIAAAAPGDAVTGQALEWQRLLRERGHEGEVVAEHVHPSLSRRVRRLDAGGAALLQGASLVLHYSVWSASAEAALAAPGPLAVYYHNVTPGHLLRPWNRALAAECDRARERLPDVVTRADLLLAVSGFNARELGALTRRDVEVLPLILGTEPAKDDVVPDGPPVILSVGRIAPNKRLEDVVRAFALYQRRRAPAATLALVGAADGFESYAAALRRLAERVGISGLAMPGRVSDEERDAWFRRAHAYLCMSVHEGFCAPLIEAMAHGVPVVARAAAAIPETVDGAGLLVDDDVALAAEALDEVVSNPHTRSGLTAAAGRRLATLAPAALSDRVAAALAPVLES